MPYKDPEERRQNSKRWRDEKIQQGYGRALYARRKQRYENEETLRAAIAEALVLLKALNHNGAARVLREGLKNAPEIGAPIEYMPVPKGKKK